MAKPNNWLGKNKMFVIIAIIIIAGAFIYFNSNKGTGTTETTATNPVLTIHYYDANMNEITQSVISTMALVDNIPTQVQYISFSIKVTNTGNVRLKIKPSTATPTAFNVAIQGIQPVELDPGQSYTFTSGPIDVDIILNAQ